MSNSGDSGVSTMRMNRRKAVVFRATTRIARGLDRRFSSANTNSSSWAFVKDGNYASRAWNDPTFMVNFSLRSDEFQVESIRFTNRA